MSSTINIYTTAPQREHKATEECRRARIKAALPRSKLRKASFGRISSPLAAGYVYAESKPVNSEFMRSKLGTVPRAVVTALWAHARVRDAPLRANPFSAGDKVVIVRGHMAEIAATVIETRKQTCIITYSLLGKQHQQAIPYDALRPG